MTEQNLDWSPVRSRHVVGNKVIEEQGNGKFVLGISRDRLFPYLFIHVPVSVGILIFLILVRFHPVVLIIFFSIIVKFPGRLFLVLYEYFHPIIF